MYDDPAKEWFRKRFENVDCLKVVLTGVAISLIGIILFNWDFRGLIRGIFSYVENNPRAAGVFVTLLTAVAAYKQLSLLNKKRYINAINQERIQWINDLRKTFNNYLSNLREIHSDKYTTREVQKKIDENASYIYLLTNPKEEHVKRLYELIDTFSKANSINKLNYLNNDKKYGYNFLGINKRIEATEIIMQIILKTEWKIIKEETKKGKEKSEGIKKRYIKNTTASIKKTSNLPKIEEDIEHERSENAQ